MMQLLVPLGLLGLLSILVLILIYIIRPNYQVKYVSSTYIWKLSLRKKKKKLPTSRIRNLLIFLCQILILTLIAGVLAMPVLREEGKGEEYEVIAIVDSSASMYAGKDGDSRFLRALDTVTDLADDVFARNGYFSVVLADDDPDYLLRRITAGNRNALNNAVEELADEQYSCYFGESDINKAMELCEEALDDNPSAEIYLITDTTYSYEPEGIEVINVAEEGEWNAAILNATAVLEDNYYTVTVEMACYGVDREVELQVLVNGADYFDEVDSGERRPLPSMSVLCERNVKKTVIFREEIGEDSRDTIYCGLTPTEKFYSFKDIQISIQADDYFSIDNIYSIYGGQKEVVKVQYASSLPNPFFTGALDVLKNEFADRWNLQITDVRQGDEFASEGFDFYIFEHQMPEVLPTDGVSFLVDPVEGVPIGSGLYWGGVSDFNRQSVALTAGEAHPLTQYIIADDLTVSRIVTLAHDGSYKELLTCDRKPVLLAQKEGAMQVAVLAFSLHYSNIAERPEFYILLHNLFEYYLPSTVQGNTFEVGEEIAVDSRGPSVTVSGENDPITEFPTTLKFDLPGTYTLSTSSYYNKERPSVELYIKIPEIESNTDRTEDSFTAPYRAPEEGFLYDDLLIYLAAALVLLVMFEFWLQGRDSR